MEMVIIKQKVKAVAQRIIPFPDSLIPHNTFQNLHTIHQNQAMLILRPQVSKFYPRLSLAIVAIFIMIFGLDQNAVAQQQSLFTQYMFNQLALNPAYAGVHDGISVMGLWREQWVGLEGAPSTQVISVHSPLNYRPVSLGAVVYSDKIGLNKTTGAQFSYAYRIFISDKTQVSFGLQGSILNVRADYSDGSVIDPSLANANINNFFPNVGSGIMVHNQNFYVSFSSPHLINQRLDKDNPLSQARLSRHYYLLAGYVFDISDNIKLKPNFMFKAVQGAPAQIDLNMNALLAKFLWVGASYRSLQGVDLLLQFQLTSNLQLGYAFDINANRDLRQINNATHEVMLNYVFELPRKKVETPRYF